MIDKDILEFDKRSKNIVDEDSDDENEMNNAAPASMSFAEIGGGATEMKSSSPSAWLFGRVRFICHQKQLQVDPQNHSRNAKPRQKGKSKSSSSFNKQARTSIGNRISMQAAGERDVILILKQVTTCSPRRATRLKKSLA
ncbi:hypothetical protein TNCV_469521 [Trichonephila clavipes]|nr:hypothetical protein TNCV_469521 [Trichonephila clavipes]